MLRLNKHNITTHLFYLWLIKKIRMGGAVCPLGMPSMSAVFVDFLTSVAVATMHLCDHLAVGRCTCPKCTKPHSPK